MRKKGGRGLMVDEIVMGGGADRGGERGIWECGGGECSSEGVVRGAGGG